MKYLALLRGINVGGKNIISKEMLRQVFVDLGFDNVRTYIQSGNILFRSSNKKPKEIAAQIEKELSSRFSYSARAVVLSYDQYKSALNSAPVNWGKDNQQKHNALFLLGDTTAKKVSSELPPSKPGIETIAFGKSVIFWSVSKESLAKTSKKRLKRAMKTVWIWCRNNRHENVTEQHKSLCLKLRGHYQYYGIRGNYRPLELLRTHTEKAWRRWLSRRSRTSNINWESFDRMRLVLPLPRLRIVHDI